MYWCVTYMHPDFAPGQKLKESKLIVWMLHVTRNLGPLVYVFSTPMSAVRVLCGAK